MVLNQATLGSRKAWINSNKFIGTYRPDPAYSELSRTRFSVSLIFSLLTLGLSKQALRAK